MNCNIGVCSARLDRFTTPFTIPMRQKMLSQKTANLEAKVGGFISSIWNVYEARSFVHQVTSFARKQGNLRVLM